MRFTKINSTVCALFIYLFIYLFTYALVSVFQLLTEFKSPIDSVVFHFDDFNYEDDHNHIFLAIAAQLGFFHNL
jgi:hypothetical protein